MDIANLTEAVAKGSKGDKQALTDIYNLTSSMVYFTALKITQNDNDAEDLVQESYVKAFQSLGTLKDGAAFIKWLKTITANLCKNQLKKSKPVLFESEEQQVYELGIIPETNEDFIPEQYLLSKEKSRLVMKIVDSLPELQRTAVILYYYNELSVEEIAAIMDTSEGTVKSRLNYARAKIKSEVEKLEGKGTKLYSMAAIPVLSQILRGAAQDYNLSADGSAAILSEVLKAGTKPVESASSSGTSSVATSSAGTKPVESASSSGTTTATSMTDTLIQAAAPAKEAVVSFSAIIAKLSAASVLSKITIGLVTLGIVAGGAVIGRAVIKNSSGQESKGLSGSVSAGTYDISPSMPVSTYDIFDTVPSNTYETSVSMPPSTNELTGSVPAADSSAQEPAEKAGLITQSTYPESSQALDSTAVEMEFTDIYKNYFLKNFQDKNPQAFFADLTHDGQDEMIVNYGDGMSGELAIITIDKNKQAIQIYSAYCDTTTNQQYTYMLYTENGNDYLMVSASFQRQGNPKEFYTIFSLSETGQEILYKENIIEYVINENGDIEGTTQAELDQLYLEKEDYKGKSQLLLDSSTGDMIYPKGETFTSGPD